MKQILIAAVLGMFLMSCAAHNQIRVYEGGPGTKEKPKEPTLTVDNAPVKGEITYEHVKGDGEVIKATIKQDGGSRWNPLSYLRQMISDVVALVLRTAGGVQVPVSN